MINVTVTNRNKKSRKFGALEDYRIDETNIFILDKRVNLRHENRLAEFWSGRKFHKKKEIPFAIVRAIRRRIF